MLKPIGPITDEELVLMESARAAVRSLADAIAVGIMQSDLVQHRHARAGS